LLCGIQKKPTAQTAHMIFADTKVNGKKNKRAVFFANARPKIEKNIMGNRNKRK